MTLPQLDALANLWQQLPPAAVQLKRIAQWLGIKDPAPLKLDKTSANDALMEAQAAGMPVLQKPNDPDLQFLEGLETWQPTRMK